jgi:hypothetical protein
MKFDPITKNLYTDAGKFIKKLRCPMAQRWEQLDARPDSPHRHCGECESSVLDTATLSDHDLLAAVRADPDACLSINAKQPNLTIFREESERH